jgi:sigma-B regulation protein RsbU (phosphoserine phosphatase)
MKRTLTNVAAGPTGDLTPESRGRDETRHVTLGGICREAIDEALLAQPSQPIEFERWDDMPGAWDHDLLLEVVRTLLSNALSHGTAGQPVIVSVIDGGKEALISVANQGAPISNPFRDWQFDPTRRGHWSSDRRALLVAKEIVRTQGGRIELTSDSSTTVFHVWLPKERERSSAISKGDLS